MNFPSSYSPSKFTKLTGEPYDLDCPNPSCQGWLNVFARKGETKPCFLRCANSSKNNNGDCTVSTIFSAKESACPACHRSIKRVFSVNILTLLHAFFIILLFNKGEILAAFDESRTWFHAKCVADGAASAETITCVRCDKVLLDTDTTKFINICGKLREVHARCGIKRSISEATNTSVESLD